MKIFAFLTACLLASVAQAEPVELVVDFKDSVGWEQIHKAEHLSHTELHPNSVMFSADKITTTFVEQSRVQEVLDELNGDSDVEVAEVSQIYSIDAESTEVEDSQTASDLNAPNDKWYPKQKWHMDMLHIVEAWKTTTGKGVIVAVLDTGVADGTDPAYPRVGDLANTKVLRGFDFTKNKDGAPDLHGHGTHVASTIAESSGNEIGGIGEAPGATILPVRVLGDNGSGSTAGIADGIRYAVDQGSDVINLSLGGGGESKVLADAIAYAKQKGVLAFCAAGNTPSEQVHYPSAYDGCFAISAVGPGAQPGLAEASNPATAQLATYSSYGGAGGKKGIFVTGPGGDKQKYGIEGGVWQSTIAGSMGTGQPDPTKWSVISANGTSMSCPSVSGVAALVISVLKQKHDGKFDYDEAVSIIADTAYDKGDTKRYGTGVVDAAAAVKEAGRSSESHKGRWALMGTLAAGIFFITRKRK